jgi:tetraacyldisaccharide 4'-kinase
MRAPSFWRAPAGWLATLLAPLGQLYAGETARRIALPGWCAPVPVICCGNAVAGGSGKTTLALDIGARLIAHGRRAAFITRGHGGSLRGMARVQGHDAARFGDEALLLAALAPTYAGADRAAAARLAVAEGAEVLVMDDGLQNPTLAKTLSLLVIDGASGFGNGRVIPAGPLREPVAAAASRCRAVVLIGADVTGALAALPPGLPVLRATLRADGRAAALAGQRVLGVAGIGRPEKFAETLRGAGVEVAGLRGFADHHRYSAADLACLRTEAAGLGAMLVTTPKDAVRLPPGFAAIVGVELVWDQPTAIEALLSP